LHRLDLRPRLVTVPRQEMLTADGVSARVTVVLRTTIADPVRYLTTSQEPVLEVYAAAQQAPRAAAAGLDLDALLGARTSLRPAVAGWARVALLAARTSWGPEWLDQVRHAADRVGMAVDEVAVRAVMLPGELRRAYADTVLARQRGLAELVRARAEAATLRSM